MLVFLRAVKVTLMRFLPLFPKDFLFRIVNFLLGNLEACAMIFGCALRVF
jgi:hypothetical protein